MNSVFKENGGVMETGKTEGGGAIAIVDAIVNLDNCVLTDNTAVDGGSIYVDRTGRLAVNYTEFRANSADLSGGALTVKMKSTINIIGGTSFESNSATSGGAIAATGNSTVTVVRSTFSSNDATSQGGAVYVSETAHFNTSGAVFVSNSGTFGGAIYIAGTRLGTFTSSYFLYNSASMRGGAFFCQRIDKVDMQRLTCTNNIAPSGGCIFWVSETDPHPVYPCNECVMGRNSKYDLATNTRSVEVMWWPQNVSSGLTVMEPEDEESYADIKSRNQSLEKTMLIWPRLKAIDLYGQIEVLDNSTSCSAASDSGNSGNLSGYVNFKPRDTIDASSGVVSFKDAKFSATPRDKPYHLEMECQIQGFGSISFLQSFEVIPCQPGFSTENG